MTAFIVMLIVGLLLGFIGAGGSGIIIAVLVTFFHVEPHVALGTAVTVMVLSVIVGGWSHFKEGNLNVKQGILIGLFGGAGAYSGTFVARWMNPDLLLFLTAGVLTLSGILIWRKTKLGMSELEDIQPAHSLTCPAIGISTGFISGTCGIGSAPLIQLSLLKWMHYTMPVAAGTTMLIIMPMAVSASIGYIQAGFLDVIIFAKVASGIMLGSYFGAKLTKRLPSRVLRYGMVSVPFGSALMLIVNLFLSF